MGCSGPFLGLDLNFDASGSNLQPYNLGQPLKNLDRRRSLEQAVHLREEPVSVYSMVRNVGFYAANGYGGLASARMVTTESSYSQTIR